MGWGGKVTSKPVTLAPCGGDPPRKAPNSPAKQWRVVQVLYDATTHSRPVHIVFLAQTFAKMPL